MISRKSSGDSSVYPRVCGGNRGYIFPDVIRLGLSPRVRGKLGVRVGNRMRPRSIPACAGETMSGFGALRRIAVYPRVCGGNFSKPAGEAYEKGLSPRVRGKPAREGYEISGLGSIPACAGETCGRNRTPPSR